MAKSGSLARIRARAHSRVGADTKVVFVWFYKLRDQINAWADRNGVVEKRFEAFADHVDVPVRNIYRLFEMSHDDTEARDVKVGTLIRYAHALGVSVDSLMSWRIVDKQSLEEFVSP